MTRLPILIVLILSGCSSPCYNNNFLNITNYKINITYYTLLGVGVDDPTFLLPTADTELRSAPFRSIDAKIGGLIECLQSKNIKFNFKPECISVKIPSDDLYRSPCSNKLLFPCDINDQICIDKGLNVTEECPCNCRSILQDNTIITTPELENFKGELARLITGANNPWISMGECL